MPHLTVLPKLPFRLWVEDESPLLNMPYNLASSLIFMEVVLRLPELGRKLSYISDAEDQGLLYLTVI
jgi:hypothetical protein